MSHWIALLKARAIENDMFVIGCNSCGDDGQTEYAGHSIVINPNGEIIAQLEGKPDHISCNIDLDEVTTQRKTFQFSKIFALIYINKHQNKNRELGRDSRFL